MSINTIEVLKKTSKSLFIKLIGVVLSLLVSIFLGRSLGVEDFGIVNLLIQINTVLIVFILFGIDTFIIKDVAIAKNNNEYSRIYNTIFNAVRIVSLFAMLIIILSLFSSSYLANQIFKIKTFSIPFIISIIGLFPQTISRIYTSALIGYKKIWQSFFLEYVLIIIFVGLGLLFLKITNLEINVLNVMILYLVGRFLIVFISKKYWLKLFKYSFKTNINFKKTIKKSLPFLMINGTVIITANTDILMLGWLKTPYEVGLYGVAIKIALFVSLILPITNASLAPKLALMYSQNKLAKINIMVKEITTFLLLSAIIIIFIFVLLGKNILNLWGEDFTQAYYILMILSAGQFFNVLTGSSGMLLMMCGYEKSHSYISFIFVFLNIVLNYYLINNFGAVGAAIATSLTLSVENFVKLFFVKKKLGITVTPNLSFMIKTIKKYKPDNVL